MTRSRGVGWVTARVDVVEDPGAFWNAPLGLSDSVGVVDGEGPAAGVDHEEDRTTALVGGVAAHRGAVDQQVVTGAIGVDRATAAAARGA